MKFPKTKQKTKKTGFRKKRDGYFFLKKVSIPFSLIWFYQSFVYLKYMNKFYL